MGRKNAKVRARNAYRAAQRDHRSKYAIGTQSGARKQARSSRQPSPLERADVEFLYVDSLHANVGS